MRFVWVTIGVFNVCLWTFANAEDWAWARHRYEPVDRSDSPWDSPVCRPSLAQTRPARRRTPLGKAIRAVVRKEGIEEEIQPWPRGCSTWPPGTHDLSESTVPVQSGRDFSTGGALRDETVTYKYGLGTQP